MAISLAASPPRAAFERLVERWWRLALIVAAAALGLAMRLTYNHAMPLWFDETFTGVIAGQPTLGGLWHWLRTELTGPFYYAPMWAWAQVAGVSTTALRLPSLLCTLAAPLFVRRRGHPDAGVRLAWAVVLLLWLPAAALASDARPYALLMLLETLQIAAFGGLMRGATRPAALRWVLATVAIGLTHYVALLPGLVQGLLLLGRHRRASFRLWPAALPFAVLGGWMILHIPFVAHVAGTGMGQTTTLTGYVVGQMPSLIAGDAFFATLLAVPLLWSVVGLARQARWHMTPDGWTALAGVSGFLVLFAVGFVMPGLALRYFIPTLPGVLFAVGWWLAGALDRREAAGAAFVLAMLVGAVGLAASGWRDTSIDQRHAFGHDLASRWLAERPTPQPLGRALFFWSDTTADLAPELDRNIAEVGGFFLRRAGRPVAVDVIHVPQSAPAAAAVIARADAHGDGAILWVGNAPSSAAVRQPARLLADPRWECRDFGAGMAMSLACRRR